jgi:hypothetical protein
VTRGCYELSPVCASSAADSSPACTSAAVRRLRLTQRGILERLPRVVGGVRSGSHGFVYRLGPAGQGLAVRHGWQPARRYQAHVPGMLFLAHALQVAELHTLLVEAERAGHVELLSLEAEPACHRPSGGFTLKPDSYVEMGTGDFVDSYFIEIDRSTEGSRALDGQLRRYVSHYESGLEQRERGVFPKVLWLVPDVQRAGIVEDCIERLPRHSWELFAVAPWADALGALTGTPDQHTPNAGSDRQE